MSSDVKTCALRHSHPITALCCLIALSFLSPFEELMGGWDLVVQGKYP